MTPVHFSGETAVLKPSPGWDSAKHGPCSDLPIMQRGGICISCWQPTLRERIMLLFGRKIYLHVASGATQPPVAIVVEA